MRMIDFRAWDKKKSEILDVMDIDFSGNKVGVCNVPKRMFKDGRLHTIHSIERDWNEVELMQSTGLKDKNGTEIFEGDIVKYKDRYSYEIKVGVIEWGDLMWAIGKEPLQSFINYHEGAPVVGVDCYLEVIGNIYENPELLEEI